MIYPVRDTSTSATKTTLAHNATNFQQHVYYRFWNYL